MHRSHAYDDKASRRYHDYTRESKNPKAISNKNNRHSRKMLRPSTSDSISQRSDFISLDFNKIVNVLDELKKQFEIYEKEHLNRNTKNNQKLRNAFVMDRGDYVTQENQSYKKEYQIADYYNHTSDYVRSSYEYRKSRNTRKEDKITSNTDNNKSQKRSKSLCQYRSSGSAEASPKRKSKRNHTTLTQQSTQDAQTSNPKSQVHTDSDGIKVLFKRQKQTERQPAKTSNDHDRTPQMKNKPLYKNYKKDTENMFQMTKYSNKHEMVKPEPTTLAQDKVKKTSDLFQLSMPTTQSNLQDISRSFYFNRIPLSKTNRGKKSPKTIVKETRHHIRKTGHEHQESVKKSKHSVRSLLTEHDKFSTEDTLVRLSVLDKLYTMVKYVLVGLLGLIWLPCLILGYLGALIIDYTLKPKDISHLSLSHTFIRKLSHLISSTDNTISQKKNAIKVQKETNARDITKTKRKTLIHKNKHKDTLSKIVKEVQGSKTDNGLFQNKNRFHWIDVYKAVRHCNKKRAQESKQTLNTIDTGKSCSYSWNSSRSSPHSLSTYGFTPNHRYTTLLPIICKTNAVKSDHKQKICEKLKLNREKEVKGKKGEISRPLGKFKINGKSSNKEDVKTTGNRGKKINQRVKTSTSEKSEPKGKKCKSRILGKAKYFKTSSCQDTNKKRNPQRKKIKKEFSATKEKNRDKREGISGKCRKKRDHSKSSRGVEKGKEKVIETREKNKKIMKPTSEHKTDKLERSKMYMESRSEKKCIKKLEEHHRATLGAKDKKCKISHKGRNDMNSSEKDTINTIGKRGKTETADTREKKGRQGKERNQGKFGHLKKHNKKNCEDRKGEKRKGKMNLLAIFGKKQRFMKLEEDPGRKRERKKNTAKSKITEIITGKDKKSRKDKKSKTCSKSETDSGNDNDRKIKNKRKQEHDKIKTMSDAKKKKAIKSEKEKCLRKGISDVTLSQKNVKGTKKKLQLKCTEREKQRQDKEKNLQKKGRKPSKYRISRESKTSPETECEEKNSKRGKRRKEKTSGIDEKSEKKVRSSKKEKRIKVKRKKSQELGAKTNTKLARDKGKKSGTDETVCSSNTKQYPKVDQVPSKKESDKKRVSTEKMEEKRKCEKRGVFEKNKINNEVSKKYSDETTGIQKKTCSGDEGKGNKKANISSKNLCTIKKREGEKKSKKHKERDNTEKVKETLAEKRKHEKCGFFGKYKINRKVSKKTSDETTEIKSDKEKCKKKAEVVSKDYKVSRKKREIEKKSKRDKERDSTEKVKETLEEKGKHQKCGFFGKHKINRKASKKFSDETTGIKSDEGKCKKKAEVFSKDYKVYRTKSEIEKKSKRDKGRDSTEKVKETLEEKGKHQKRGFFGKHKINRKASKKFSDETTGIKSDEGKCKKKAEVFSKDYKVYRTKSEIEKKSKRDKERDSTEKVKETLEEKRKHQKRGFFGKHKINRKASKNFSDETTGIKSDEGICKKKAEVFSKDYKLCRTKSEIEKKSEISGEKEKVSCKLRPRESRQHDNKNLKNKKEKGKKSPRSRTRDRNIDKDRKRSRERSISRMDKGDYKCTSRGRLSNSIKFFKKMASALSNCASVDKMNRGDGIKEIQKQDKSNKKKYLYNHATKRHKNKCYKFSKSAMKKIEADEKSIDSFISEQSKSVKKQSKQTHSSGTVSPCCESYRSPPRQKFFEDFASDLIDLMKGCFHGCMYVLAVAVWIPCLCCCYTFAQFCCKML